MPRQDGKLYTPGHGQDEFHQSTARYKCIFGGRGSGKTAAGSQESLRYIKRGMSGAVLNPDFENFKTSTWPEFRQWIPWQTVIPEDRRMAEFGWEPSRPFTVHFENGAVVRCKGLRDPGQARGPNISWLWYDEGGRDRTGEAWRLAIASVRIPGPNGEPPGAWVTTTPRGTRHWTAEYFVRHEMPEAARELLLEIGHHGRLYEYFTATIHDNRHNLDPLFYASMLSAYTGKFARQELDGQVVDVAEGTVYDNFTVDNIGDEAEYQPGRGAVELAVDDGFSISPRVFLFIQVDDHGTACVFDELYHLRHQPATCIGEAKEKLMEHRRRHVPAGLDDLAAERHLWEKLQGDRFEIAICDPSAAQLRDAFRHADIVARGGPCTLEEGIKNAYRLVASDPDEHGQVVRRLLVHPRCKNFIREMSEDYRYPQGSSRHDGSKPVKEDDHGPDAFRYWAWMRMRRR